MATNRLYFGDYCEDEIPLCLKGINTKCKSCNTPKCKKHLKNGLCKKCDLKPEFYRIRCWQCKSTKNLTTNDEGKTLPLCKNCQDLLNLRTQLSKLARKVK